MAFALTTHHSLRAVRAVASDGAPRNDGIGATSREAVRSGSEPGKLNVEWSAGDVSKAGTGGVGGFVKAQLFGEQPS